MSGIQIVAVNGSARLPAPGRASPNGTIIRCLKRFLAREIFRARDGRLPSLRRKPTDLDAAVNDHLDI